jgi:hypothetical protein
MAFSSIMAFNAKPRVRRSTSSFRPKAACRDRARGNLATTQNVGARAFVDFILSDEGQNLAVSMGYTSRRARAPRLAARWARINIMPTDIGKAAEANSANLKRFAELFGN